MAPRALIFDLDGTLWDSQHLYAAVIESVGGPYAAVTQDSLLEGGSIATLLRQVGITNRNFASSVAKHISLLTFYPSVLSSLGTLQSNGIPLGIVTSLPSWIWRPLVEITGLGDQVKVIEGSRRGFPKAAGIKAALSRLSVLAYREVWYVGDLPSDSIAAKNAGVSFAWASWGYYEETLSDTDQQLISFREVLLL